MKKASFIIIICVLSFFLANIPYSASETFTKYTGKTKEDMEFAKAVYELLNPHGVLAVEVDGSIMAVHVSETLYRGMRYDTISGKKTCRNLARMLQKHTGQKPVTIWVYFDGTRVIETDYQLWKDRFSVNYLD